MDVFYIMDIDELTTKEEVEAALKKISGLDIPGCFDVSNMRPTRGKCQAAIVRVAKEVVNNLEKINRTPISITNCRIYRRIEVRRCYRCWECGHSAAECKETDRSELCGNCGQKGHVRSDCKSESFCPLCEIRGHQGGNTR